MPSIATRGAGSIKGYGFAGAGVPGAPTGVTGTLGNQQVSVAFTAPTNNGGLNITSYTVTSSPGAFTTTGSSSPLVVTGLTNGTAYTFTVKATNAAGTGPNSTASASVTPVALRTLWSWGVNTYGQLGLGNTTNYADTQGPKQVGALTNWLSVTNNYFSLAIKTDGTLWAWGRNIAGQLGLGNTTDYSSPKQVGALTNWSKIAVTSQNSFAIKTDGTLWGWGGGGQIGGFGVFTSYSSPKQIGTSTNWSKISSTFFGINALAIKTDGTLWGWGANQFGELGLGNTSMYISFPTQIGTLTNWSKIANGNYRTAAIKTDGTLWAWGRNAQGQLGLGNTTYYSSPKQVGALTTWSNVSMCGGHTLATKIDGTLWSWGINTSGQLGLGNTTYAFSSPVQVGALSNWKNVASVSSTSVATKTDGTLWGWGQSGYLLATGRSSPQQVGAFTKWELDNAIPSGGSIILIQNV